MLVMQTGIIRAVNLLPHPERERCSGYLEATRSAFSVDIDSARLRGVAHVAGVAASPVCVSTAAACPVASRKHACTTAKLGPLASPSRRPPPQPYTASLEKAIMLCQATAQLRFLRSNLVEAKLRSLEHISRKRRAGRVGD